MSQSQRFYGWWIAIAAFFTFGLAVGIPYYGMPFFYDYYEKSFGWQRSDITLGFPLAVTLTLWVGPMLVHRFSPRLLIIGGTAATALAFAGFSQMKGDLWFYYGCCSSTLSATFFWPDSASGDHFAVVPEASRQAMAATYLGVGVFGASRKSTLPSH